MLNQCSAAAAPNPHNQEAQTLEALGDLPWPPPISGGAARTPRGGAFLQLSLRLLSHGCLLPVCLCLLFGEDSGCIGFRAHPNAIGPRFKLTNDMGRDATCRASVWTWILGGHYASRCLAGGRETRDMQSCTCSLRAADTCSAPHPLRGPFHVRGCDRSGFIGVGRVALGPTLSVCGYTERCSHRG